MSGPDTRAEALGKLPCAWVRLDERGIVVEANDGLSRLTGSPVEEATGKSFDALLTHASKVLHQSYLQPLLRLHGNVEEMALTLATRDGPPADVLFYSAAHMGADGGRTLDVVLVPIRKRRGIEAEVLRVKRAADASPSLIFQLMRLPEGAWHFAYVSEAVRALYGTTPNDARASAEALFGQVHADDRAALDATLRAVAVDETAGICRYRVARADGELRWHELHCVPSALAGDVMLWHGHIADITERHALEAALAERAASDRLRRLQGEFLARVSHELRTPLNGILGFAQLLLSDRDEALRTEQRDHLGIIESSGKHLLHLVNQVLDISSMESMQLALELAPTPLAPLLDEALAIVRHDAAARGLQLTVPRPGPGEVRVIANALRLRQVLVNLLSNAIKYNRPGGTVSAQVDRIADTVSIAISDTGLGMSEDQQAQLFEPFNRLGVQRVVPEGTGLGLVITKHLLALMGGSLSVSSREAVGSTFTVTLPSVPPAGSPQPAVDAPAGSDAAPTAADVADDAEPTRGSVLYVEDNRVNAVLMEAIFGMRPGIELRVAEDSARAKSLLATFRPDLLLIDAHLPDGTGAELLGEIRRLPGLGDVPAIAVSAAAREDDVIAARRSGFADHWAKPLNIADTLAEIDRWLGDGHRPPA